MSTNTSKLDRQVPTVVDVTTETFQREVVERSRELPVVVDFWAAWCGPCRMLGPVLEREIEARAGEVALAKVDTDANQALAGEYGIRGIPAVKAFRNGRVVAEFVGALPPQAVAQFLDELTGPSRTERLLAELRQSGEAPELVLALEREDYERSLELLLGQAERENGERRQRARELAVELFADLGDEHPLTQLYRRRLAAVLY